MRTIIIFILSILIFTSHTYAQKKDNVIPWDAGRQLNWKDYNGQADNNAPNDARTFGGMNYEYQKQANGDLKFILYVTFDPKQSWVKKKKATDYLLNHEQCHFDIYEIYGRILMKQLHDQNIFKDKNFNNKVKELFQNNFHDMYKFQDEYDKETHHSEIEPKQKEWTEKIKAMLTQYKDYTSMEVIFKP